MQDRMIPLSVSVIDNDEDRLRGIIDVNGGKAVFKVLTDDGQFTPGQWRVETILEAAEQEVSTTVSSNARKKKEILSIHGNWELINLQEIAAEIRFHMGRDPR